MDASSSGSTQSAPLQVMLTRDETIERNDVQNISSFKWTQLLPLDSYEVIERWQQQINSVNLSYIWGKESFLNHVAAIHYKKQL